MGNEKRHTFKHPAPVCYLCPANKLFVNASVFPLFRVSLQIQHESFFMKTNVLCFLFFYPTVYCIQEYKKEKIKHFLQVIYHIRSGYLNEAWRN